MKLAKPCDIRLEGPTTNKGIRLTKALSKLVIINPSRISPSLCSFSPCPSQQVSALPLPAPLQLECSEESHVVVKVLAFFLCVQEEFDMVETHNDP